MCLLVCCATVCRLAELVFAAVHVFFCVDMCGLSDACCVCCLCVEHLYAQCVWGLVCMMCVGGLVCMMCVGLLYAICVWGTCMHDVCVGDLYA